MLKGALRGDLTSGQRDGTSQRVATALAVAYARWDGRGVPAGVGGKQIPFSVRVSIVVRDLEIWTLEAGAAHRVLEEGRGRAYDPDVIGAALGIGLENCATVCPICGAVIGAMAVAAGVGCRDRSSAGGARRCRLPAFCIETQIDVLNPCHQAGGRPGTVQSVRDVALAAVQRVVATLSADDVVAAPTEHDVVPGAGHDDVVALSAEDRAGSDNGGWHLPTRRTA